MHRLPLPFPHAEWGAHRAGRNACASRRPGREANGAGWPFRWGRPSGRLAAGGEFARSEWLGCQPSDDAAGLVAPVAIAQQALVQLARRLARQLAVEVDRLRALVVREVVAAVR